MVKHKYYVVWVGREPGIYTSWETCKAQVKGFAGAAYKAFTNKEEAARAFCEERKGTMAGERDKTSIGKVAPTHLKPVAIDGVQNPPDWRSDTILPLPSAVEADAIAVDAACSGNPGRMEYRGVDLQTGAELFHFGPMYGTNNIGEFLAIVHALALLKKEGRVRTIYSDSRNAISWVRQRRCKTKLVENGKTAKLYEIIRRAETWLASNSIDVPIKKWETKSWGEVPADFGRK